MIHCLKEIVGINDFEEVSKKKKQEDKTREWYYEYSYDFEIIKFFDLEKLKNEYFKDTEQ